MKIVGQDDRASCCEGLADAPLDEDRAAELAKIFKALGYPVRLRLLSMIASRGGTGVHYWGLPGVLDRVADFLTAARPVEVPV